MRPSSWFIFWKNSRINWNNLQGIGPETSLSQVMLCHDDGKEVNCKRGHKVPNLAKLEYKTSRVPFVTCYAEVIEKDLF